MNTYTIKSLDDLYFYYNEIKEENVEAKAISIAVDDFLDTFEFVLDYKDNLERLNGTIDVTLASSIMDLQEFINNLYKVIKYQDNPHTLSDDELDSLRIYVKISEGSTKELIKNTRKFLENMVENMTGTEKIIVVTIVAMALTGGYLGNDYINYLNSKDEIIAETEQNKEETIRTKAIIKGFSDVTREIALRPIYKDAIKQGQKAILKPVRQNNSYTLLPSDTLDKDNTTIKSEYIINDVKAKEILRSTRNSSEINIINDNYIVKYIEALDDRRKYKVKLISSTSDISGIVEIDIDNEDINFSELSSHLASRSAIELTVKTKTIKNNTVIDRLIATITTD